jgi:hypothetical protein
MTTYTISTATTSTINMTTSDITIVTSSGSITTTGSNSINVTTNSNSSYILNDGTIQSDNNCILFTSTSAFGTLTNNNNASITGNIGIDLFNSTISSLENNGTINCDDAIIINDSNITSYFTNNGNIVSNASNSYGIEIVNSSINILNNSGNIISATSYGIYLTPSLNASQINVLNNFGSIINQDESDASILCGSGSTITTLNNLQSDLTYEGDLPINYNIIINSQFNYGRLKSKGLGVVNAINFGIYPSSTINSGRYVGVLVGLNSGNINTSTRSGIFNTYYSWQLELQEGQTDIWDLVITALNPACVEQIGGPQPPRLWTREEGGCFEPTPQITQYDLDMRRKAEILKYKANSAQLTKKQQWSQNVRGAGPNGKRVWANQNVYGSNPNTQNLQRIGNTLILPCVNNGGVVCSPSSASDVPGPVVNLCYNPNIPLINYKVQRTYLASGTKWPLIGSKPK